MEGITFLAKSEDLRSSSNRDLQHFHGRKLTNLHIERTIHSQFQDQKIQRLLTGNETLIVIPTKKLNVSHKSG